jgi:hypothetical protein
MHTVREDAADQMVVGSRPGERSSEGEESDVPEPEEAYYEGKESLG